MRPLIVSEEHENFYLEKKIEVDPSVGLPNNRHIICQFCEVIIIPESQATKVLLDVDMIKNNLREFDLCDKFWTVDQVTKFQNCEVHQLDDFIKYLCCLSCQSQIIGFMIKETGEIYVACDRVKLELYNPQ